MFGLSRDIHQVIAVINLIEDITRWREDMNFIFEWQNNILRTSAAESKILFLPRDK